MSTCLYYIICALISSLMFVFVLVVLLLSVNLLFVASLDSPFSLVSSSSFSPPVASYSSSSFSSSSSSASSSSPSSSLSSTCCPPSPSPFSSTPPAFLLLHPILTALKKYLLPKTKTPEVRKALQNFSRAKILHVLLHVYSLHNMRNMCVVWFLVSAHKSLLRHCTHPLAVLPRLLAS